MSRAEVLPGTGTVIRFGNLVVWAGPPASGALLSFLVQSARNVGAGPDSGRQVVDHVSGILASRDPEPGAPFAVIGPDGGSWSLLLHGPVQAWDGVRWLAPTPTPGWIRTSVTPSPAISVGPAGSPSPRLVLDSPYDLVAGMVPGGGVIVVPEQAGAPAPLVAPGPAQPAALFGTAVPAPTPTGAVTAPPPVTSPPVTPPSMAAPPAGPVPFVADAPGLPAPPAVPAPWTPPGPAPATETGAHFAAPPAPSPAPEPDAPAGPGEILDLRAVSDPPGPPLPPGALPAPADRPEVLGIDCPNGHLNHPGATTCVWCATPIPPGTPPRMQRRPTLGILLADDGAVFRLQRDVLVGSAPATDAGVVSGRFAPLTLPAPGGVLAPVHAEIRLNEWLVTVVDRGAAAGTFIAGAGGSWERLTPFQPATLPPGAHLSVGQRVLTYLAPWE